MRRAARARIFAAQCEERPDPSGIDVSNRQGKRSASDRSIHARSCVRAEVSHHPRGVSQKARAMVSVLWVLTSNTDGIVVALAR